MTHHRSREYWLHELEHGLDDDPINRMQEPRRYNSLKHFGLYEKALVLTWIHHHDDDDVSFLPFFERANRNRLRAEGDTFSYKGDVTLYRGLSGTGVRRAVKGLSWTDDIAIATLFAYRWHSLKYRVQPHLEHRAANPTVYTVTVPAEGVLTFIDGLGGRGKNEREYIVHPDHLPEPTAVEMDFETIDFNRCKYAWGENFQIVRCPTLEEYLSGTQQ